MSMMGHLEGLGLFEQLPQTLLFVLSAALLVLEQIRYERCSP
jgi:hypothetical protein